MPYLKSEDRARLISGDAPVTAGELNFCITNICIDFLALSEGRYADYNTIVGALENVKLEFVRRAVVPYEQEKIIEHGDVY